VAFAQLADLVPPNLRHPLHVNLLVHGREVCKSPRPLCDRCEIRNFCSTFRGTEVKRAERSKAPTVVDLFGSGDAVTIRSREAAVSRLSAWTTRHDLVPAGQMGEFRSYFYIR
jgi:DNA (cytosine-5)-methyltransferase 1